MLIPNAAGVCKSGVREILYTGQLTVPASMLPPANWGPLQQSQMRGAFLAQPFRENSLLEAFSAPREGPGRMDGDVIEIVEGQSQMNGIGVGAAGGVLEEPRAPPNDIFLDYLFIVQEVVAADEISCLLRCVKQCKATPDTAYTLRVIDRSASHIVWQVLQTEHRCYLREVSPFPSSHALVNTHTIASSMC
jgi:hypothetical protein